MSYKLSVSNSDTQKDEEPAPDEVFKIDEKTITWIKHLFGLEGIVATPDGVVVMSNDSIKQSVHPIGPKDDIVILAYGIWIVISYAEVIQFIRRLFKSGERDPQKIGELVCEEALKRIYRDKISVDNISCVIIILPGAVIGNRDDDDDDDDVPELIDPEM